MCISRTARVSAPLNTFGFERSQIKEIGIFRYQLRYMPGKSMLTPITVASKPAMRRC